MQHKVGDAALVRLSTFRTLLMSCHKALLVCRGLSSAASSSEASVATVVAAQVALGTCSEPSRLIKADKVGDMISSA